MIIPIKHKASHRVHGPALSQPPTHGTKRRTTAESIPTTRNFKHVDRFCALKQLKLDKTLRWRGAAKQETHMQVCRAAGCGVHFEVNVVGRK